MKFLSTILVGLLAYGPVAAIAQEVRTGSWPDGAQVAFQCQHGTNGAVKFIFVTLDGKEYAGIFSCGVGT